MASLSNDERFIILSTENVYITWEQIEECARMIAKDIDQKYRDQKVCLLGAARGGLIPLIRISHLLDMRDISIIQVKLTATDDPIYEGNTMRPEIVLECLKNQFDQFILIEDVIETGTTCNEVIKLIESYGKKVVETYALYVRESFIEKGRELEKNTPLSYIYTKPDECWAFLPWEVKVDLNQI